MSFDVGYIVPMHRPIEVYPGDTFTMKYGGFLRVLSPLDAPIMDNLEYNIESFYVPMRDRDWETID